VVDWPGEEGSPVELIRGRWELEAPVLRLAGTMGWKMEQLLEVSVLKAGD